VRRLWRALGAIWNAAGIGIVLVAGYWLGSNVGYGRGARDLARLVIEMRQAGYETPEPWDSGDI
jgi:hypothetical protein